jgi:hypothetical protein
VPLAVALRQFDRVELEQVAVGPPSADQQHAARLLYLLDSGMAPIILRAQAGEALTVDQERQILAVANLEDRAGFARWAAQMRANWEERKRLVHGLTEPESVLTKTARGWQLQTPDGTKLTHPKKRAAEADHQQRWRDALDRTGDERRALRKAREAFPAQWQAYQGRLREVATSFGVDPAELEGIRSPVLVRERIDAVDRAAFAREANAPPLLQMSTLENAVIDAKRLTDETLLRLHVREDQSIDLALRARGNAAFVRDFMQTLPDNERAILMRADGSLNQMGIWRIKAALFTRTFPGDAGRRLAEMFTEALELRMLIPWIKPVSLPESVRDRCPVTHEWLIVLTPANKRPTITCRSSTRICSIWATKQ